VSIEIDIAQTKAEAGRRAGHTLAVVSSLGAGLATVVGKWNLESISPLLMSALIFTTATIVLSVAWLPFRGDKTIFPLSKQGWLWLGLFTTSSFLAIWIFWAGVQQIDPSLAAFINRAEVPIAIFLGIVFLRERFSRLEILGMIISIAGIVVMRLTLRFEYSTGFWLVLLGALFFGITEFVSKIAVRHVEPVVLAYLRNGMMALIYWMVFLAGGEDLGGLSRVWPGVLALGIIGPILSRMMYLLALKRVELSRVAVISQTQPVFVILIALLFLGQFPTFREILGGVLITTGSLIMIAYRRSKTVSQS